ncbi:glutathione S-transferase family protein [Dyella acidiphila]|uniref:Glutathione S-transferase n=1 Tax=Dyella acidiphila TaxID=2775866 RepID=A0ABR9G5D7_9GAMM|nr:glutathione S-transferase [Dyella acidiphila]MBE1159272.1 glutathione S-transferase [Dyella acidiphila]
MITVHHLNNSRSQRILWLLEELGLPYEIKRYQRDPRTMLAPPELRAVHPLGKSPVVTDGERTLVESGAIIEYLADRYGNGRLIPPHGSDARLRSTYWLHYAEGSAMPPLLLKLVFQRVQSTPAPFFVRPVAKAIAGKVQQSFVDPQIALHLSYLEGELTKAEWFGGTDFSVADIIMSFPLEAAAMRSGLDQRYPRLQAFLQRIHARPAYQRALQQGGEYSLLSG